MEDESFFKGWDFNKVLDLGFKSVDKYNTVKANENVEAETERRAYADSVQASNEMFSLRSMDKNKKLLIGGGIATVIALALIFK